MEKKRKTAAVEITIEKDPEEEKLHKDPWHCPRRDLRVVQFGDHHLIETVLPKYDSEVNLWFRNRAREPRRGALVAGLALFRGWSGCSYIRPRHPPTRSICALSLCLGGSHCLLYQLEPDYCNRIPRPLKEFLADPRISIVGVGIKSDAEELQKAFGLHLGKPVELRTLAAKAFGKEKVWTWKDGVRLVVEGLTLKGLAELGFDGSRVEEKPPKVADSNWGGDLEDEHMMHATVDAFLCFEVGLKCLEMIGRFT